MELIAGPAVRHIVTFCIGQQEGVVIATAAIFFLKHRQYPQYYCSRQPTHPVLYPTANGAFEIIDNSRLCLQVTSAKALG